MWKVSPNRSTYVMVKRILPVSEHDLKNKYLNRNRVLWQFISSYLENCTWVWYLHDFGRKRTVLEYSKLQYIYMHTVTATKIKCTHILEMVSLRVIHRYASRLNLSIFLNSDMLVIVVRNTKYNWSIIWKDQNDGKDVESCKRVSLHSAMKILKPFLIWKNVWNWRKILIGRYSERSHRM